MSPRQSLPAEFVANVGAVLHLYPNYCSCDDSHPSLVIREFCPLDTPILMVPANYSREHPDGLKDGTGKVEEVTLGYLLPHSFGPGHLDLPRKS